MASFLLEPDELDPERPERRRPVRLVSTGLADTAEVPRSTRAEPAPCYGPCAACGASVLTGTTTAGVRQCLDVSQACYAVTWANAATVPTLLPSRAYPVHPCAGLKT